MKPEPKHAPGSLARKAGALLASTRARSAVRHEPGVRDAIRNQLLETIALARQALASDNEPEGQASARLTLLEALAAQAADARYGAGQLSRGAQRAPTVADCEDGWARVEEIVTTAEAAAAEAHEVGRHRRPDDRRASSWVRAAKRSAEEARQILDHRNHAYTFHANPRFSFGEGWYLAAAAVISKQGFSERMAFQIEPDQRQTKQVEHFIEEAGLRDLLVPYRSRPRANKALTDIVARGFRADPASVQQAVRRAFLGDGPLYAPVVAWADRGLAGAPSGPKVLMWVRYAQHHPHRNTSYEELLELATLARDAGLIPVLVGDALRVQNKCPTDAVDWTLFWKQALFQGNEMRRAQLHLFEHLRRAHDLVGQIGVTTAGMDGPALIGLPTLYLTDDSNVRMRAWVGAVPGYEEVVRVEGYLERVSHRLRQWASD